MKKGVKHLVECHCVLPQYRTQKDPTYHKFVVFSEIDEDDIVIIKHAQCNNCGVIHRILDIAKSEIITGNDESAAIITISDIKLSIPQNVISVLETYHADIATWEQVQFILDNQQWGSHVVLSSEMKGDNVEGKLLKFPSSTSMKIEPYSWSPMLGKNE